MLLKLGDNIDEWPLRIVRAVQISLLIGISVLWRKLYKFFKTYPWALVPAFDDTRTDEERRTTLQNFFDADSCCLDMGLGRQLRKAFPSRFDQYLGTPLGQFLTTVFTRLAVTSTQVELQFSRLTVLTDTRNKRLGLAGLAAKSMNYGFKQLVDRWRADVLAGQVRVATSRARPVWTKSRNKGAKVAAFDLYKSDTHIKMKADGSLDGVEQKDHLRAVQAAALERWQCEPANIQADYEDRAQ